MGNEREDTVGEALDRLGYLSKKSGWPDFLVEDTENDFIFCIEVKSEKDHVRSGQQLVHKILDKAGIPVIIIKAWANSDVHNLMEDIERLVGKAYREWYREGIHAHHKSRGLSAWE